jgi:hypothetical protein
LLRFKDLKCVGINNWPTLKRRVSQDNFPPGRYVGKNTRVWTIEEVEAWWASRPIAGPPPDIVKDPPLPPGQGRTAAGGKPKSPFVTTGHSQQTDSPQAFLAKEGE